MTIPPWTEQSTPGPSNQSKSDLSTPGLADPPILTGIIKIHYANLLLGPAQLFYPKSKFAVLAVWGSF